MKSDHNIIPSTYNMRPDSGTNYTPVADVVGFKDQTVTQVPHGVQLLVVIHQKTKAMLIAVIS